MAIVNLGIPHLGPSKIPQSERIAWPSRRFPAPDAIECHSAPSVTNEFYFRRSTAMARALELLGADVFYLVFHVGIEPDVGNYPLFSGAAVVLDNNASDNEGAGLYHDASNGLLIVEHVRDPDQQVTLFFGQGMKRRSEVVTQIHHFHVAVYGNDRRDPFTRLDFDELYRMMYEDSEKGIASQDVLVRAFGRGNRSFLPIYFHNPQGTSRRAQKSGPHVPSVLRVPMGLPPKRIYGIKTGLPKHHICYLNFQSSPYFLRDPVWR